jgi:peptide/nickel transport system permease protein
VVVWLLIGIPVGIVSAIKRRSLLDRAAMGTALLFVSAPVYWLGLIALYLFASDIGIIPVFPGANSYVGLTFDPGKWFASLILPWFVLAATSAAIYARLLRGSLIDVMDQDYIRTARAKGHRERAVILGHAFKNALIPVVTVVGQQFSVLLGGTVIVEFIFLQPGVGSLLLDAVQLRDYTVIQGAVLFFAAVIVFVNLLVDVSYAWLDPRIRYR